MSKEQFIPQIKREWCKSCGLCVKFCPKDVFEKDLLGNPYVANPDACVACNMCDYRCPDFAITFVKK
ncbi:4Fe-4S dicluster domain-containing protein [Sporomusa acidovorans]|uniref:Ion-translocating oxidoreductase complex subunit B n=1 Tax=Sporomusa acidovorans (strain ATCC 49682 / DSM 3132 / Mol) TaxID=1123286 RepID=A0ABZ3IXC1_SPOA4|nr:4Fe-4S binding protein [Sporomusa acidovorans]OZC13047.1 electron transport complex subunit RsxB [Sporomusa acidovorans DSM 3132]SDF51210.1 2-oxoglutarate ferredoxin oxidoreductase subunit delta [Sporomusa acidovorans]